MGPASVFCPLLTWVFYDSITNVNVQNPWLSIKNSRPLLKVPENYQQSMMQIYSSKGYVKSSS